MGKTVSREWVKTAAIIFLSVLLLLTFFSNTIMNRTLPEVSSAAVTDGPITAKVRGSGTVEAISQTEVKASSTRYVGSVNVKEGQEVEVGDVLFVMGAAESEEVEAAHDTLDSLYWDRRRAAASYPTNTASADYWAVKSADDNLTIAEEEYDAALKVYTDTTRSSSEAIAAAYDDMEQKEGNYNDTVKYWNGQRETALIEFKNASAAYYNKPESEQSEKLYNDMKEAEAKYQNLLPEQQEELDALDLYQSAQQYYDELVERSEPSLFEMKETARRNRDNAADKYYAAYDAYMATVNAIGQSSTNVSINIGELDEKIDKAEKKVAELEGTENNEITANIAGVVTSVSVSPGARVEKDMVMCVIEVPDRGYSCSFSVTNDQAKRLKVGDTAEVSNYYWGSSILATLTSIKVDTKDPQTKKVLTFELEGDVNAGTLLTISVGSKSSNYDVIVPNSAVRTDSNGKFVLMLDAKNSPLGNRYFAKRVDVEVLAEDDINSAISGNISNGDFVITTTSSPIKSGDQVRMSDNG